VIHHLNVVTLPADEPGMLQEKSSWSSRISKEQCGQLLAPRVSQPAVE